MIHKKFFGIFFRDVQEINDRMIFSSKSNNKNQKYEEEEDNEDH